MNNDDFDKLNKILNKGVNPDYDQKIDDMLRKDISKAAHDVLYDPICDEIEELLKSGNIANKQGKTGSAKTKKVTDKDLKEFIEGLCRKHSVSSNMIASAFRERVRLSRDGFDRAQSEGELNMLKMEHNVYAGMCERIFVACAKDVTPRE